MIWYRSNDNDSDIHDDNSRAGPHSHLGEDLADETPLEPPHSPYSLLRLSLSLLSLSLLSLSLLSLSLLSLSLLSLTLSSPCSSLLSWIFDTPGTLKPPHWPYSRLRLSLSLSWSSSWSSQASLLFMIIIMIMLVIIVIDTLGASWLQSLELIPISVSGGGRRRVQVRTTNI